MSDTPRRSARPTVVKLGGSLASSAVKLTEWLGLLAPFGGRIVVVPGGGPFADFVRVEQARWGFSDSAADHMALLAMEQFGRLLADLRPGLRPSDSRAAIRRALEAGEVPVWMPTRMVVDRPDVPASWDVTSDSLALWLAARIGASDVVLVKSAPTPIPTPAGRLIAAELAARGLIDAAFPGFLERAGVAAWYLGPDDGRMLARALNGGGDPGYRIDVGSPAGRGRAPC